MKKKKISLTLNNFDALVQSKPSENLANTSPMESNFEIMVHEVLKVQNLVFDYSIITLLFQLSMKLNRSFI